MEKRLLLAIVLSVLVMLLSPLFLGKPASVLEPNAHMQPIEQEEVREVYSKPEQIQDVEKTLPSSAISKTFRNNKYRFIMKDIGGSIQNITVKDLRDFDTDLVNNAIYQAGILSIEGKGALAGLSAQPFAIKEDTASLIARKDNLTIKKSIRFFKDQYGIGASIKITNNSSLPQLLSFDITTASNISNKEVFESRYIQADVLYKDGKLKKIAGGNFKKPNRLYTSQIEWLALKNKYYSIIAKPSFITSGAFTKNIEGSPVIGFMVDNQRLLSGESRTYDFLFYIGPTQAHELGKVDQSFGKALNFGIFTGISLVLLSILRFFYSLFHNYGVAILLLTCCVSVMLFPLSFKSLKSMRHLQELQPQMEEMRRQYKDNPQKLNKEMMELYRRHKVNPMGGCFPILLQMPIFLAFYQTLMRSVELKGATFLWIKDLSMPDAAFTLPTTLPLLGNSINLLPILMIGAMIMQQKLSQGRAAAQTDQQKMMAAIMPVMFGFIFYSLPSGLVLYWLTNTVLTSSLQFFALKKA